MVVLSSYSDSQDIVSCTVEDADTIGNKVADIRVELNMTQKEFAEAILVSRATIIKIEKENDISEECSFRLYYAMQKIIENIYMPPDLKNRCKTVQGKKKKKIILRNVRGYSPIAYSVE